MIEAASVSYGKATAYFPVIELLRGYFQIELHDDTRKIREKVTAKLLALDRALEPALPALLALLDVSVDDEEWLRLDPGQRRQRTLETVKRLLLRESQVQPLVVVFEDLHWIDGETQAVLEGLVESVPTARLLLLISYRPEYQHAWGSKMYYRQLRIDALSATNADELLGTLLGTDSSLEELKRLLITRTEANPFFLEESVRTLVETKVLSGEEGEYRLARALEGLQIPASAQAMLAARIDRLAPEDKRMLQAAAVIGRDVPLMVLEAVVRMPVRAMTQHIARLQAAEFLYETKLFPEAEYTFKHALTHEVTYSGLLHERRRQLHALVVDAIEETYADRLVEHVESLAYHAVRGERWGKALQYLRQAGTKAMDRSAYREATAFFEQALTVLERQPVGSATLEQAIDVRFQLRTALIPLTEFGRALGLIREAEALAETLGDASRRARASVYLSISSYVAGELAPALASAQRARILGEELNDVGLQAVGTLYVGFAMMASTDYQGAQEYFRRAAALLDGGLHHQRLGLSELPAIQSRARRAWCLAELGHFGEATSIGEDAIRIGEAVNHPSSMVWAYWGTGYTYLRKGELLTSIAWLERALRSMPGPLYLHYVGSALGVAYALSGRITDGIELLQKVVERDATTGFLAEYALGVTFLGEAYLAAGRLTEATERAHDAHRLAQRRREPGFEAYALRLIGDIGLRHNAVDDSAAESSYRQAIAIADGLGMRPLIAHCHLGLGELYRRIDKREQAREHLATATAMYREMGMAYWLEKVEA